MKPYSLLPLLLLAASCHTEQPTPAEPSVYADATYWYDNGRAINPELADVFYVLPTCIHTWTDSLGQTQRLATPTDAKQRERMRPSYELADQIFADSANLFAPYYRQVSLETWAEPQAVADSLSAIALADVREAFAYYLREQNQGRPFVLAGFSQGARYVRELVKTLDPDVAPQLIAAYICGYSLTAQDTIGAPFLRPAQGADDTGVTIVYNTVADTLGLTPLLSTANIWVHNPASWTQDEDLHPLNPEVSIRIDQRHKVLIAEGIDADQQFIPKYADLFPRGCLHLLELTLYNEQLRQNVRQRIAAYQR